MKKLLRSIRKAGFINRPLRRFFRGMRSLEARWPVAGVVPCRFEDLNFKLYNKCDDHIVDFFYYDRPFHESKIFRLMKLFAQKSTCIVDIGANTGVHSVISAISNPSCKVLAVEPYSPNYKRLEINKNLNGCSNISLISHALGSTRGELKFFIPIDDSITDVSSAVPAHGNRIYPEVKWKETTVTQITLDDLTEKAGRIDFFKCDVESFEAEVIKGANEFFESNRPPFIIEITLDDEKCEYFNQFATENNYHVYLITDEGLCKLKSITNFDRWPNFLFTQYEHPHNFVSNRELDEFVSKCFSTQPIMLNRVELAGIPGA